MSTLPTREEIAEILKHAWGDHYGHWDQVADALLARVQPAFDRLATLENWIEAHGEHCAITPSADALRTERDALRADLKRAAR